MFAAARQRSIFALNVILQYLFPNIYLNPVFLISLSPLKDSALKQRLIVAVFVPRSHRFTLRTWQKLGRMD